MSNDNITLNCLVHGDTPPSERVFSVLIPKGASIGDLRKLVKVEKVPRFDHIAADELVLWKVDIPLYTPNNMLTALQTNPNSAIAEVLHGEKLPVLFEVGECFTLELNKKNIHVIVQRPAIVASPAVEPRPIARARRPRKTNKPVGIPKSKSYNGDEQVPARTPSPELSSYEVEYQPSVDLVKDAAEVLFNTWKESFIAIIAAGFPLNSYKITNHPCATYINSANIPSIEKRCNLPKFILHSLPDLKDNTGYVEWHIREKLIRESDERSWFMLLGTSGAGKTRSVYELLCKRYGIYLTFASGSTGKNMGSRDLDAVVGVLYTKLEADQHEKNSDTALFEIRTVLAGRLFILVKLLQLGLESFTPRIWLLMQLLPKNVGLDPYDFWVTISKTFASSERWDIEEYIVETMTTLRKLIKTRIPDQAQVPVAIDEAQLAIDKHIKMFHSTTSTDKRSFFAILLRMVLDLDCGTCTILSGTGLRIDDLKLDAGSAVASDKKIQPDDFICITDGFDNINNMKLFIERFMGTLSERQANTIFQYIRGRRRFVITYMERAFDESNKTDDDMDVLVEAWRDKAASEIVGDLAQKIAQISKRNFWADMEETIIDCHFFSGRSIVDSVDTAFAVEVGFARLDKIKQSSRGIVVVAGISEPLAIMAYLRYARTYKTVAQKILKLIGKNQWDPSHLGKLFERYLLEPLSKLFDGKKGELCNHPLFSPCIGNDHLTELFSSRIEIDRHLTGLWNEDCPNLCATGDLITYLNNPKLPFILPEKFAGPDIAFVINIYVNGDYDNPVRIPVFVQAKLRPYVDFNEAIKTVSPRTFFDNTQHNSFAEKRKNAIKCLADKFGRAAELGVGSIGMLIAYPCEFRGYSSRYDAANKELILVVDAANAGEFFESKTIDVLRTVKVKASLEKQRTLDDWTNYVHK